MTIRLRMRLEGHERVHACRRRDFPLRRACGMWDVQLTWEGVPACYQCSSVALSQRHGYLIFRKR